MNLKDYFAISYEMAAGSPDTSSQNGAILLHGNEIISKGRNEFPPGCEWDAEKLKDRDWKMFNIEHAERNSIFSLARTGFPIEKFDVTMVCPWLACSDCSRAIVLNGIKKVVAHQERMNNTPDRWKASVAAGLKIIADGGVKIEYWSGKVGCKPILANGELWYP